MCRNSSSPDPDPKGCSHQEFIRLFLDSERELLRYVMVLVPNVADARDVVQEAGIALWEKIELYDRNKPFVPWACRFALNEARMFLRKQGRQGLMDNTIIVFTSDNGPVIGSKTRNMEPGYGHIPIGSAYPLRGGKATIYEGGSRVPLIINWPGVTQANTFNTQAIVQSIDFFPTLGEMCGLGADAFGPLDGESFVPAIKGEPFDRDTIYCHFPHIIGKDGPPPSSYVRQGDWKLIRFYADNPDQSDRLELYNLAQNIGETCDVSAENPEKTAHLNALLDQWLVQSGAVVPIPNPNYRRGK